LASFNSSKAALARDASAWFHTNLVNRPLTDQTKKTNKQTNRILLGGSALDVKFRLHLLKRRLVCNLRELAIQRCLELGLQGELDLLAISCSVPSGSTVRDLFGKARNNSSWVRNELNIKP
jgi:hypothetical protein